MTRHIETRNRIKSIYSIDEFNKVMDKCVLSDEERLIMEMHYIRKLSLIYIAYELGYSESCIKQKEICKKNKARQGFEVNLLFSNCKTTAQTIRN